MKAEDLHARLRVRVIGRLEAQPMDAHLGEEDFHEADEAAEGKTKVGDDALDLVELRQMGGVDRLVAEDAVNGEVAGRARVGGEAVQHVGGDCGRVGAQDEAQ